LIEQGLTSNQAHYRSYRGLVFTGQMTQPTLSKHWRNVSRWKLQVPVLGRRKKRCARV